MEIRLGAIIHFKLDVQRFFSEAKVGVAKYAAFDFSSVTCFCCSPLLPLQSRGA
jgi:hypothetical protein